MAGLSPIKAAVVTMSVPFATRMDATSWRKAWGVQVGKIRVFLLQPVPHAVQILCNVVRIHRSTVLIGKQVAAFLPEIQHIRISREGAFLLAGALLNFHNLNGKILERYAFRFGGFCRFFFFTGCDKLALLLKMDGFALDQRFDLPRVQFRRNTDGFDKRWELLAKFIPPVKNVDTKRNRGSGLIVQISEQLKFSPIPVIYTDERVSLNSLISEDLRRDTMKFFVESITTKSPEWSYEKEWRIIRDESVCDTRWDKVNKGALLKMIRPTSIILGCRTEWDFEKSVREYCEKEKVTLYKMEKNKEKYQLDKKVLMKFSE